MVQTPRCLKTAIVLICAGWAGIGALSAPTAQSSEAPDSSETRVRNWTITIPVWVPGYRGTFAIGDIEVGGGSTGGDGGAFLSRLFDKSAKLNFVFMGAVKYDRGPWRFHGDVFGGKFTTDVIFKLTDGTITSASVRAEIATLYAAYRVFERPWGESGYQRVRASVYSGLRLYDIGLAVTVQNKHNLTNIWVDPIVGVWVPVDLSRRWRAQMWSDIGGFGVGSNFSWHVSAAVTFQANDLISISLGYSILGVDFNDAVASLDFVYNVHVGGPLAGIGFSF